MSSQQAACLFDLDSALVDSVYERVLVWHGTPETEGIDLSISRIHHKIGMSGRLFANIVRATCMPSNLVAGFVGPP